MRVIWNCLNGFALQVSWKAQWTLTLTTTRLWGSMQGSCVLSLDTEPSFYPELQTDDSNLRCVPVWDARCCKRPGRFILWDTSKRCLSRCQLVRATTSPHFLFPVCMSCCQGPCLKLGLLLALPELQGHLGSNWKLWGAQLWTHIFPSHHNSSHLALGTKPNETGERKAW